MSTDAERLLWSRLRDRRLGGYKFRRQHPIGAYYADFACVEARLVVEIDGGQHFEDDTMKEDRRRSEALATHGFEVIRFTNRQMLTETDAVTAAIFEWLACHHPHPSPLPRAGEGATQGTP